MPSGFELYSTRRFTVSRHTMKIFASVVFAACLLSTQQLSWGAKTIQVESQNRLLEGRPLFWNKQQVVLLGRDGQLLRFQPSRAKSPREGSTFRPFSRSQMRGALLRDFDRGFEVSGTGQFLVVHPAGQRDVWAHLKRSAFRLRSYLAPFQVIPQVPMWLSTVASLSEFSSKKIG